MYYHHLRKYYISITNTKYLANKSLCLDLPNTLKLLQANTFFKLKNEQLESYNSIIHIKLL